MIHYKDYIKKVTPVNGVFSEKRKKLGIINNSIKWLSLRLSYLFYIIGLKPNAMDVIGLIIIFFGYYHLLKGFTEQINSSIIIGWSLMCFHVVIDYMDGAIARALDIKSSIGDAMDNIGLDVSRFLLFAVIGLLTEERVYFLTNIFSSMILLILFFKTYNEITNNIFTQSMINIIGGRWSVLGVRFSLGILPLALIIYYYSGFEIQILCTYISLFYLSLALVWLILCMPSYSNSSIDNKK